MEKRRMIKRQGWISTTIGIISVFALLTSGLWAEEGHNKEEKHKKKEEHKKGEHKQEKHKEDHKKAGHHGPHWGYEGARGPAHWGEAFPECGLGKSQSPLDIQGPFEKATDALRISYKISPLKIINNGHTIQVNYAPGSSVTIGKETYELLQFHFHRPSEEKIDGRPRAMVAHFVHKSKEGKLAVIGVLLDFGDENELIKTLWENLPKEEGEESVVENVTIDAAQLLPQKLGYYHYPGSLTTPPCTEGVNFYILKQTKSISRAQLDAFPFKLNARPVQPLNDRKISESPS
jgi:carbonic anhydrase